MAISKKQIKTWAGALIDVEHAAFYLGCSATQVRQRIRLGQLPARKLGSRVLFVKSELEAFIRDLPPVVVIDRDEGDLL